MTAAGRDAFGMYTVVPGMLPVAPVVSVVMAVYNDRSRRLKASAASILGQSLRALEFVIVDDGSSPEVASRLDNLALSDARVTLIRNEMNIGLTRSLVRGVRHARAPIIARQDADDVSVPQRLARQLRFFPGADVVCCRTRINDRRISPRFLTTLLFPLLFPFRNPFIHGTLVFKRAVYDAAGGYDPDLRYAQDYGLMKRVLANGARVKYLADVLYLSRKTSDCISLKFRQEQRACFDAVRRRP